MKEKWIIQMFGNKQITNIGVNKLIKVLIWEQLHETKSVQIGIAEK